MKDTIDEVAKLQTLIELYRPKAVTSFQKSLLRTLERINGKLLSMPSEFTATRLNALKREIAEMIANDYAPFIDNLLSDNLEIINMSYAVYAGSLADDFVAIPQSAVNRILNPNRHLLGQTLKEVSDGLQSKQVSTYKRVIADGLLRGDGAEVIAKELRDYNDGTLRHHINAITKTSMNSAIQEAYIEASKQSDEVIEIAFSNGILDSRTSPICQEQLGKHVKRNDGESFEAFRDRALKKLIATPRHVNCRSKIIFETKEAFDNRSNKDKPAIVDSDIKITKHRDGTTSKKHTNKEVEFYKQDITYDKFFNQQSPAFQKSVLGDAKYKLFKQGRLKISQLRDIKSNRFLSNDEIMKLL
jgi:hypothetical protein